MQRPPALLLAMPDHTNFVFRTELGNPPPLKVICTCDDFWSVAQQYAMEQLYPPDLKAAAQENVVELSREPPRIVSPEPPGHPPPVMVCPAGSAESDKALVPYQKSEYPGEQVRYSVRAIRIAAAYARTFLEEFGIGRPGPGKPELMGRFYWAGLAAFASKQVSFLVRHFAVANYSPSTFRALGKGNLWLFNDALPWHYAWAVCPESVRKCASLRDARNLHPIVLSNLLGQEWSHEVLDFIPWNFNERTATFGAPIGQLQQSPVMDEVIKSWGKLEAAQTEAKRAGYALAHLRAMARHEQGEVLQGLVYSDPKVREDLARARDWERRTHASRLVLTFRIQLSFSADQYVDDPEWRSDAPVGIRLEDYAERMSWIDDTARKYHDLMQGACRDRMLRELRALADLDG